MGSNGPVIPSVQCGRRQLGRDDEGHEQMVREADACSLVSHARHGRWLLAELARWAGFRQAGPSCQLCFGTLDTVLETSNCRRLPDAAPAIRGRWVGSARVSIRCYCPGDLADWYVASGSSAGRTKRGEEAIVLTRHWAIGFSRRSQPIHDGSALGWFIRDDGSRSPAHSPPRPLPY